MTVSEVKRNIWRNTASNYLCLGLRLVLGLVMFRLLYRRLGAEEFGFWALLWSFFGYGVLLDFGFGFTAQKRVAELSVGRQWAKLSQVLSTIFFSYVGLGGLIAAVGLAISPSAVHWFHVSAANQEEFREILVYFFVGLGLSFPLGLFPEMLRGQQRIALANGIFSAGMIVNFVLSVAALQFAWGFKALFLIAILCTCIPDLICGVCALRAIREVQIRPRNFSRGMISETMSFSLFAYVTTVSNVILAKTDQLVISSVLGVAAVALYQAGAKLAEMFTAVSQPLPDTLSPAAAHLHACGDREVLQRLLVDASRFTVMLATPVYLICAFYMVPLLQILTGEAATSTYWVGQILLLWSYTSVVTQSVTKRVYMMCGHERRLMWLGVGEAVLNLVISVALALYYRSILGVAAGSLISTFIFGWFLLWPWAAREAQLSGFRFAWFVLGPTWLACLPLLALIGVEKALLHFDFRNNLAWMFVGSALASAVAFWGLWRLALTREERTKLAGLAAKTLAKWRPA